jgi:hypothetical protein
VQFSTLSDEVGRGYARLLKRAENRFVRVRRKSAECTVRSLFLVSAEVLSDSGQPSRGLFTRADSSICGVAAEEVFGQRLSRNDLEEHMLIAVIHAHYGTVTKTEQHLLPCSELDI